MYKKFLNAILFGALILGSAGTITSCKDYDDEIDEINQKLNTLSSKDELAAQVSSLTSTISAAQAAAAQASTEAANALANAKEAAAQAEKAATGAGQATGQAAEAITNAKAAATTADNAAAAAKEAAATAAKASADAAKAVAAGEDATKALADAKKAADAAAATAKEAAEAAAAAKKAADEAAKSAGTAAAKAVADAQVAIADAAKKVAEESAKAAAADAVALELKAINERLEKLEKGGGSIDPKDLEEIQKAIEEAKKATNDIIGKISTAVTSVSLVDSYTAAQVLSSVAGDNAAYALTVNGQGTVANFYYELLLGKKVLDMEYGTLQDQMAENPEAFEDQMIPSISLNMPYDLDLDFTTILEKADWTADQEWGDWEKEYNNEPIEFYGIGADLKNAMTFKKNQLQPRGDYFVVRVSPTNAELKADQIQLVNSVGENMNEFLTYAVQPFTGKLSRIADVNINTDLLGKTRAEGDSETGLWIVKATMKKGLTTEQLKKFAEMTVWTNDINVPSSVFPQDEDEVNPGIPSEAALKAVTRSTVNLDDASSEEDPGTAIATVINKYLFAVQVNNTAEDAADRYVTSSYDLTMGTSAFQPANRLHFTVNGTRVEEWNNRFVSPSLSFVNGSTQYTCIDQEYEERVWLPDMVDAKPNIVLKPQAAPTDPVQNAEVNDKVYDIPNQNLVGYADYDDRSQKPVLMVKRGEKFTIALEANQGWAYTPKQEEKGRVQAEIVAAVKPVETAKAVKAVYVKLDQPNAVESNPSEWVAWKSYEYGYDGIDKVIPVNADGTCTIDLSVDGWSIVTTRGDVIGFRVYAINWDGTLVDPDGRAFYVQVASDEVAAGTQTIIKPRSDKDFVTVDEDGEETELEFAEEGWPVSDAKDFAFTEKQLKRAAKFVWSADIIKYTDNNVGDGKWSDKDEEQIFEEISFSPRFLDKDGEELWTIESETGDLPDVDLTKVASVVTLPVIPNWLAYIDDKEYKGVLTLQNDKGDAIASIPISMTKVIPNEAPAGFEVKTDQLTEGIYHALLVPSIIADGEATPSWDAFTATHGAMRMLDVFNMGDSENDPKDVESLAANYIITFAKADFKADGKTVIDNPVLGTETLAVPAKFIDGETEHATTVKYNYGKISTKDYDAKNDVFKDHIVPVADFNTIFYDIYDLNFPKIQYHWYAITLPEYKAMYAASATKLPADAVFEIEYGQTDKTINLKYILGKGKDKEYNGTLAAPYKNSLSVFDEDGEAEVLLVTKEGKNAGIAEYFDVEVAEGVLKFTPKSTDTTPMVNVPSVLKITVYDSYSHDYHVVEVDMTVKPRVN